MPLAHLSGTRFSKQRREAKTDAEKAAFTAASNEHKQGVFADRAVGRRLMFLSESSTRQDSPYMPEKGVLYISLDGMDQAIGFDSALFFFRNGLT